MAATDKDRVGLVNAVTSNRDGSVIVAATDAGIVSLMRGSDGQVLATRKVSSSFAKEEASIHLSWISQERLLIECPTDNDGASTSTSTLTLVSNIHGKTLNHENPKWQHADATDCVGPMHSRGCSELS